MIIELTDQQLATAIAALRFYNQAGMGDPLYRSEEIHTLATANGSVISASDDEIHCLVVALKTAQSSHVSLTEDEWIAAFAPEAWDNGDYYRQRQWSDPDDQPVLEKAAAENRCWTCVEDDDGNLCIVEGARLVNRMYHLVTAQPYDSGKTYDVRDPDSEDGEGADGCEGGDADSAGEGPVNKARRIVMGESTAQPDRFKKGERAEP